MNYFIGDFEYGYYTKAKYKIAKTQLFNRKSSHLGKYGYLIPGLNILKHYLFNIYSGLYFELEAIK